MKPAREEVNRVISVCSVSEISIPTLVLAEFVYMESLLRPLEHFREWLNSIVSASDPDESLNATELLYTELFVHSLQTAFSLRCLGILCVVVLIVSALTRRGASKCFIEALERVRTLHIRYEGKLVGSS